MKQTTVRISYVMPINVNYVILMFPNLETLLFLLYLVSKRCYVRLVISYFVGKYENNLYFIENIVIFILFLQRLSIVISFKKLTK